MTRAVATDPALWAHRGAPGVSRRARLGMAACIGAGTMATLAFFEWWFRPGHVASPSLFVLLSLAVWYGIARILIGWVGHLGIARVAHRPPPAGLRVAIFTTSAPGEPPGMFEATLAACARVRYPHTTYLLDDTRDPRFAAIAARHGAVHLELLDVPGAKAGKINAALARTDEDIVLVLDPDHVPLPGFLDRVLGHFDDPAVGFVQVAQAYYNQGRSFTARAAAEQTYAFYGPGQMGLHGHGAAVAIGANCTFRRKALQSIGGHGIGLAEDLVTAIRLHAAGWRSVYVPEVVSRGLVPEDLGSFYRQQLKWARGVYEVMFTELPRAFPTLTRRQRLAYAAIGTYYLAGVTTPLFLLLPYLALWAGVSPTTMPFADFLTHGTPLAAAGVLTYLVAQRWLVDPRTERGLHWRGLTLKLACWPVFLAGTVLAVLRYDLPYIPTSKEAVRGRFLRLAWPQLLLLTLFLTTLGRAVLWRSTQLSDAEAAVTAQGTWGMLAFAVLPVLWSVGALRAAWESRRPPTGAAWDEVPTSITRGAP